MVRYLLALILAFTTAALANGQDEAGEKAPFPFPEAAPKKDWAWDKDERFDELMEQLAINEASLDAVDAAIAKKTRRKGSQLGSAKRFDENNRMMDRKGGGPMNWREFYGTNAEKFFYHPVDPNTTYHTTTALQQIGKAQDDKTSSDIPTRQSLPVHQRPPQWDYIYRANRTASETALADAALLATEVEQLEQRRAQLEQEQAVLWCKLAFRAVQRLDMHRKHILRFQLIAAGDGNEENEQARALAAAAQFLSTALLIVEKAEEEQSVAMGSANTVVVEARERFEDVLLEQPSLESSSEDKGKPLGQFVALAKLLGDKSKTLSEAYAGAMDGAANNEAARKESYRGMLQRTVIDYAQILLALNELADAMQKEWKVGVDTQNKVAQQNVEWSTAPAVPAATARPSIVPKATSGVGDAALPWDFSQVQMKGKWTQTDKSLLSPPRDSSWIEVPAAVGNEYTLLFTAVRVGEGSSLNVGLPLASGNHGMVVIGGGGAKGLLAIEMLDGKSCHNNETTRMGFVLQRDVPVKAAIRVSRNRISVSLDGRTVIDWSGDPRRLSLAEMWTVPKGVGLFLGSQTAIRFSDVVVRER